MMMLNSSSKMKKIFVLMIMMGSFFCVLSACSVVKEDRLIPDASVSGTSDEDLLKKLQDEGKLPAIGNHDKLPVLPAPPPEGGPEVTSVYPPSVDPDQDNIPNAAFNGY